MSDTSRRRIAVLLALVVGLSVVVGGAFATAPTLDTETTYTSQSTELTDGGTQTYNESSTSDLSWVADSADSKVEVYQGNEMIASFAPTNYTANGTGDWYYNYTLADDGSDYPGLDVGAGENATLTFKIINDTTATSPDHTNISVTFENTETQAIVGATDADSATAQNGYTVPGTDYVILGSDVDPAQVDDETTITANTAEIRIRMANQSDEDAFSAAADGVDAGALTTFAYVSAEGTTLPVFVDNADVSWLGDDAAYGTLATDGSTLTIHNVNESFDAGNVDLVATGNENIGITAAWGMARNAGAGYTDTAMVAASAGSDLNGDPNFE